MGHIRLENTAALNALTGEMVMSMLSVLKQWQGQNEVAFVVITGAGSKAFCAGGDVVGLHAALGAGNVSDDFTHYFCQEYTLDYFIHCFAKPIVVLGNNIVFGGGLGLLAGASHRIVTPSSKLAMPEVNIGLFPDVGASYFLSRMPGVAGKFLGLTGVHCNATDAIFLGLADYQFDISDDASFIQQLVSEDWDFNAGSFHQQLSEFCLRQQLARSFWSQGLVKQRLEQLNTAIEGKSTLLDVVTEIEKLDSSSDPWVKQAKENLRNGSPTSVNLVWEQLRRAKHMTRIECVKMELVLAYRCGESGEFREGVRALLIDKDGQPTWNYSRIDAVPKKIIDRHFQPPWTAHPLEHLNTM